MAITRRAIASICAAGAVLALTLAGSPTPARAMSGYIRALYGVSCTGPHWCMAAGYHLTDFGWNGLVEHWNGKSWTTMRVPQRTEYEQLAAVDCVSTDNCIAVGKYQRGDVYLPLVLKWNGQHWSVMTVPSLVGAQDEELLAVSCGTARRCLVVGQADGEAISLRYYAGHWKNTARPVRVSGASRGRGVYLGSVACVATYGCWATGYKWDPVLDVTHPLAERWNGIRWHIVTTPDASSGEGELDGLSCITLKSCVAVGIDGLHPLAERWDGEKWSAQSVKGPGQTSSLAGVSCAPIGRCQAVGFYQDVLNSSRWHAWATRWTGSRWIRESTPAVSVNTELWAVSCPIATACKAVGDQRQHARTLVERWNGADWAILKSPNP